MDDWPAHGRRVVEEVEFTFKLHLYQQPTFILPLHILYNLTPYCLFHVADLANLTTAGAEPLLGHNADATIRFVSWQV